MPEFRGAYPEAWDEVNERTKVDAGFRCVRCRHPNGRWSQPGNDHDHAAAVLAMRLEVPRVRVYPVDGGGAWLRCHLLPCDLLCEHDDDAQDHRILTVHHLDNDKSNLSWWNLAALCQRCHLQIQGRVTLNQTWPYPHSDWFKPYVAGYYASTVSGEELTRQEVEARLVELLVLGQPHLKEFYEHDFSSFKPDGETHDE